MNKIIAILFFIPTFCFGQIKSNHSLNTTTSYDISPRAGFTYVMEQRLASFQASTLFDTKDIYLQAKIGFELFPHKGDRFMFYPAYFDYKVGQGYRVPTGLSWTKNFGKLTTNVGGDFTLSTQRDISYSVNVSLNYNLMGNRYNPPPIDKFDNSRFRITNADLISAFFAIASGIGGGANNAFHADPYVFEKKGWKGKYWKHNGWENNYPNGQYEPGDEPIKPEFLNGFRDVNHGSEDLEIFGLTACLSIQGISEGIRLGKKQGKWWHTPVKMLGVQLIRIGAKKATYNYLRS